MFHEPFSRSRLTAVAAATFALVAGCETPPEATIATPLAPSFARTTSADVNAQLGALSAATARYQRLEAAKADEYETFTPCWEHAAHGGMGYHYANQDLLNDGAVDLLQPEALMYVPQSNGRMRLVGMEYIVFFDKWQGADPPMLLGREMEPHDTLPIYKLHIWLWRNNEAGIFADWNPAVSCEFANETEVFG